jgi:hypothetical protein
MFGFAHLFRAMITRTEYSGSRTLIRVFFVVAFVLGMALSLANDSFASVTPLNRIVSRPRISLDTSLGGMMLLHGGGNEQTEARPEVHGRRHSGGERAS